ncbi:acyltransferase [Bacteroides ovatus]|uniref:acyltransferase n=1 Tax=Bacteroides ovatus TaxID=28116 RepID=UPI00232C676E|nr:acyltransferase [Bacteroides ovatus]MDC2771564.1 acyltransferase [Bacteroides ovatus]MDC2781685.1 acyltransferase [Bacteroides ovatus]MDC2786331.1 acyltransferase [Bacteroides ovatus]MDC2791482.1 acyltransferase [Bacteroides ovatus]MDC2795931.1 acyltransferase [Bacteroides ovatus]
MIKRIIKKLRQMYYCSSSGRYLKYLKNRGVKVGERTIVFDPMKVQIDLTRPELLEIGEHVFIHRGTIILTHDWASWCFVEKYNDFIPAHAKVIIGNNVWLGENVTIMSGVEIGDNVIIGIGSVVTKSIPSDTVAVGVPAKVICTIDEYYNRRKKQMISECKEYAKAIIASGRTPTKEDFYDDYPCFVDGSNYWDYQYNYNRIFTPAQFEKWKKKHKAMFDGFDGFIKNINQ